MSQDAKRVVKYEWPGMPELTIVSMRVVESIGEDTNMISFKDFIVEAVDSSGQKWTAN